jgi:DNA-binding NarL/FixJ family response regulator
VEEAARELAEAAERHHELGIRHPGAFPVLPDAIEACADAGDVATAEILLERLTGQARALDADWPNAAAAAARGAVLLAQGEGDEAARTLATAASELERLGYRPDAARARLLEGRALLREGRRSRAANVLGEARARFAEMRAAAWEARADEELERASPGRASGELTPTERRIAGLVAEGLKNREIAETVFLSAATVEAHLTRIYRKLGIRSRSELTRLVADGSVSLGGAIEGPGPAV